MMKLPHLPTLADQKLFLKNHYSHKKIIFLISLGLGVQAWLVDSLLDYLVFYEGGFLELFILSPPKHEIYIRTLIFLTFMAFGFFVSKLLAKIQRNEFLLKETQKIARLGSWEWNPGENVLWWSEETYRIFGMAESTGITFSKYVDSIHPGDVQRLKDAISRAIAQCTPLELEYRIILPDQSTRYVHEMSVTLRDDVKSSIIRRGAVQDVTEQRLAEQKRAELSRELNKAEHEIKTLRGILPICANCKKIRDDSGAWHRLESYISRHSDAKFSHGICPKCMVELYPDYAGKKEQS